MSNRPRVLVIATVVLLSALTGAVVQPAAAAIGSDTVGSNLAAAGSAAQVSSGDVNLESGGTFWQGAGLGLEASELLDDGGELELWRVSSDGRLNQRVRTLAVDESGTHVLETDTLAGRYVLLHGGDPVSVEGGVARAGSTTVSAAEFQVTRQTLSFEWSDPTAYPGQATTLTVESNRGSSVVAVSGANLSFADLTTLFPEAVYASDHDARADEDVLLVTLDGTTSVRLDTVVLSPGTQSLVFDVVDDGTRETASLTVLEPTSDRRFRSIERREQVGDVVEAELACSHCFLILGGPGQGFLDVVELQDSNGDGNVTLRINTRYAGMFSSATGYPSGVEAYTSPEDNVDRYSPSATLESVRADLNYDVTSLNDLREQQDLPPNGRYEPIEPGQIRLTVSSSDYLIERRAYGSGPPIGADLVVKDETDVETVTLEPASLDGVSSLGAPGDGSFDVTASTLRSDAGPRDRVALGDRLVFRIDVSGVFGYLEAEGSDLETLLDNREEGLDLTLERLDGSTAEEIRVDRVASQLVADPETDSLYLVLRTGSASSNWLDAGEYRATFAVEGIDGEYDGYSTREAYTGYPYAPPGGGEEVSGTARLAEPTATITTPEPGSDPHLTADGGLRIQGTTSIAAGATLTVEAVAASPEFAWETRERATARTNGTWTGTLDLAEAPGDEFEVTVSRDGQALAQETYTVLPPLDEEGTDGNSTDGGSGSSDGSSSSGTSSQAGGSVAGLPIPDLGGFGQLAVPIGATVGGLVFVWGMWRLVIRRLLL